MAQNRLLMKKLKIGRPMQRGQIEENINSKKAQKANI